MSRRNFLKQIGLATAAIGVAPISRATVPIRSIDSNLKIGLLLPVNNGYPQLSENYLTGFKTRLASLNTNGVTTSFSYRILQNIGIPFQAKSRIAAHRQQSRHYHCPRQYKFDKRCSGFIR